MLQYVASECCDRLTKASKYWANNVRYVALDRFDRLTGAESIRQHRRWKPRPDARNISTRYFATLLGATCCVRLATMLRRVGCCWLKFENGQIFHVTFVNVTWCCSCFARLVQQCCARTCALVRFSTPNMSQHVTTVWPNARNKLRPTMLRNDASKYCYRLAGACKYWAKNVAICCVELLRSFVRRFIHRDGLGFDSLFVKSGPSAFTFSRLALPL